MNWEINYYKTSDDHIIEAVDSQFSCSEAVQIRVVMTVRVSWPSERAENDATRKLHDGVRHYISKGFHVLENRYTENAILVSYLE